MITHSGHTQWSRTVITHSGHTQWSHTVVTHSSHTHSGHAQWSHTVVTHSGHTQWSHTLVTHTGHTQWSRGQAFHANQLFAAHASTHTCLTAITPTHASPHATPTFTRAQDTHAHTHTYTHIHTYTHTHTHTKTNTHTHTNKQTHTRHGWGMFAEDTMEPAEFAIEYVGELIRTPLADARERMYQVSGSSAIPLRNWNHFWLCKCCVVA